MSAPDAEDSHATKALVRLTMACNERCPFCNVPAEDYPTRPTAPEELERQIEAVAAAGGRTLTISGGEPTLLRARLLALVRAARARGIPLVELQTNAALITPDYAAVFERGLYFPYEDRTTRPAGWVVRDGRDPSAGGRGPEAELQRPL